MPSVKLLVRTVLSLAMSAVFVWLSLRHTDVRAVGRAMAQADAARITASSSIWSGPSAGDSCCGRSGRCRSSG